MLFHFAHNSLVQSFLNFGILGQQVTRVGQGRGRRIEPGQQEDGGLGNNNFIHVFSAESCDLVSIDFMSGFRDGFCRHLNEIVVFLFANIWKSLID